MNRAVVRRALARMTAGALVVAGALGASAGAATSVPTSTPQQIAKAGVLQISDFPTGWTQSKRSASSDDALDRGAADIATCKPFLAFATANKRNPRAQSLNFDLDQDHVNNTVSIYPSVKQATASMRTFNDARLPKCLDRLFSAEFKTQLAKDTRVAKQLQSVKVDIGRLDGVEIGDEATAYEGTVAVGLKNGTVSNFGLAIIAVRLDNAVSGYSYTADTDISAALQPAIVSSLSRLKAAATAATT